MELLEKIKNKYAENVLEDKTLYYGLHNALSKIDINLYEFINTFPGPASINNTYTKVYNGQEFDDWTCGFWTGILWLAYEITNDERYKKLANHHLKSFRHRIENKIGVGHHDLGFLYTPSVVANYKLTNNELAKTTALKAADHLLSRYREKGEFIQAWGELDNPDNYRLIIDCNLNVPLLFWASEITGDRKYREIATKHLNTAANVVLRENGTTFHTYYFDLKGNPLKGVTAQGKSDDSTWARGQAWGIYGFALAYRHLKDEKFIKLYKKVTNVFINKLPEDNVCYWDLDFKKEDNEERDTSSIAIAICGILEMNKYLKDDDEDKKIYYNAATHMMKALIENYGLKTDEKGNGLLKESVYSKPHDHGVKECCMWGDYFYMESLIRFLNSNWNIYW